MAYRIAYSDYSTTTSGPPDPERWVGPAGPPGEMGPEGPGKAIIGTTPSTDTFGLLWWDSNSGQLFVQYDDGSSVQWVSANSIDASTLEGSFLPITGGTMQGPLNYTATGGNTLRSAQDRAVEGGVSVMDFGAVCDGTTNDTTAVNAALTSGANRVTIPAGKCCFLPNGITVPNGVTLEGLSFYASPPGPVGDAGFFPAFSPPSSSILTNANINSVTLGIGQTLKATALKNIVIRTNATSAPTAGAGVYVNTGYQVSCESVLVHNVYDGFYWKAINTGGITGWMDDCHTNMVSGHHVVQDTWPELRVNMCRFGGTYGALAYVYNTGGLSGNILPNTFFATNCHFNEGGPMVGAVLSIGNMVAGAGASAQEFTFNACHMEHFNYAVRTDATVTWLMKLKILGCAMFAQGTAGSSGFFHIDPATTNVTQVQIVGNDIEGPDFILGATATYVIECQIVGNNISSDISLNGGNSGFSTLSFIGNGILGDLALSGSWGGLSVDASIRDGTFTDTATGNVRVNVPGHARLSETTSLGGGVSFSGTAANGYDVSKHVNLNGLGTAGINFQGGHVNLVVPAGADLTFYYGTATNGFIDNTGINYLAIGQTGAMAGTFTSLATSNLTTLGSGAKFTGVASSATDLTKHLDINGLGTAGINYNGGNMNIGVPTGAGFSFYYGGVSGGFMDNTGINYISIGAVGAATGKFSTLANTGNLGFCGTTPITKRTGYGAPTGTATRATFATGSVTLPVLAEHVKALIDDLTSYGLIGP